MQLLKTCETWRQWGEILALPCCAIELCLFSKGRAQPLECVLGCAHKLPRGISKKIQCREAQLWAKSTGLRMSW